MDVSEKCDDGRTDVRTRGQVHLQLLGGFELRDDQGRLIELPTRKAELLLAYLAMPAGRAHAREKLATLLWGDRDDEQARGSLRKALSAIRAALGSDPVQADREMVSLSPGWLTVDAEALAVQAGTTECGEAAAMPLLSYGEFLDSKPAASSEFSDWLSFERTRCRNLAQSVFERQAKRLADAGRVGDALALARQLLAIDGLREESHRLLMRLLFKAGERSQALAQYQACRAQLREELGVEPSSETLRLSREIAGDQGDSDSRPAPAPMPVQDVRGLSIAVLPFQAHGGEPGEEFVADGLTEDLVTELSRQRDITVIAHLSTRGFSDDIEAAARDLNVRYVVTGTLRRTGGRIRISVRLIDSAGNRCIWAERYDGPAQDLFDLQDKVVAQIIANIDAEVRSGERERAARKRPESLDAWELFHRGMWHAYRFTREDMIEARYWLERAIKLAPDFALPYAGIAYVSFASVTWHFATNVEETLGEAMAMAGKALERDDRSAFGHVVLGRILTLTGSVDRALRHLEIAVELNPGFSQAYFGLAWAQFWSGKPIDALKNTDIALRLNPRDPLVSFFLTLKSCCYYWLGRFADAETAARRGAQLNAGEAWSRLALAAALIASGKTEDAIAAVGEARKIDPNLTLASFGNIVGRVPAEVRDPIFAALRQAGLN